MHLVYGESPKKKKKRLFSLYFMHPQVTSNIMFIHGTQVEILKLILYLHVKVAMSVHCKT